MTIFPLGERRIRVITLAVPVTTNLGDVFAATDQFALTSLLSKKGRVTVRVLRFSHDAHLFISCESCGARVDIKDRGRTGGDNV